MLGIELFYRHNAFNIILGDDVMNRETFEEKFDRVGKGTIDKLTILGEGSLEKGAKKFYKGFVGLRRFMGTSVRTRSQKSAGRYLMKKGLIENSSEVGSFMRYLYVSYDPEYGMGNGNNVIISSWESHGARIDGYSVSRVVR